MRNGLAQNLRCQTERLWDLTLSGVHTKISQVCLTSCETSISHWLLEAPKNERIRKVLPALVVFGSSALIDLRIAC